MSQSLASTASVGKYRLILELARGGMGHVYLAVALGPAGFNKLFVLKELKQDLSQEAGFLEMFLDEARLAARLNHPNVVQTNEVHVDGGRAFLAMEYLEGQSLVRVRSRLGKADKLPLDAHLRVLAEACRGLHYAHTLREFDGTPLHVVHRDVSPHNIFVTYDGQVKIVDFGVAKAVTSSHETGVGVMKGKMPYMAPEQVTGAPMDARVDVFALGVCLWEAIANRRMWDQTRPETILGRLMTGEIPKIADVAPETPAQLRQIVDKATAPSPDARFASAEALRMAIESYLSQTRTGDPGVLRDLGATMLEAFAAERSQVDSAVAEQLRRLKQAPEGMTAPIDVVRLSASAAASYGGVTGPNQPSAFSSGAPLPSGTAMMMSPSTSGSMPGAALAPPMPYGHHMGSHPGAAYASGSQSAASHFPAQGASLPGGGGDSGSGSRRYGRTGMGMASGASLMPPAPAKQNGAKSMLLAACILVGGGAVVAAIVVSGVNRRATARASEDSPPTTPATADTAAPTAAAATAPTTAASTATADGAAAVTAASTDAPAAGGATKGGPSPSAKGGKGFVAAPAPVPPKPGPATVAAPPPPPPRTTRPDLGY